MDESILLEAERLINGDRQKDYNHPYDNYKHIVETFNALTHHDLSIKDGLMFMVCVKLCREQFKAKRDNRTDACGYIGCLDKVEEKLNEK